MFLLRAGKNLYAFWADAFVLVFSLPLCRLADSGICMQKSGNLDFQGAPAFLYI